MNRRLLLWWAGIAVTVLACVALVAFYKYWQSWLAYQTGSRNTQGTPPNYNFWSGFGSVFPWSAGIIVTLMATLYHNARKSNCHTHGCWRVGTLPVGDGAYRVCKRCHHKITGTHATIEHLSAHHEATGPGKLAG